MRVKTIFKIGDVFGRLTILEFSHYDTHHRKHFLVKCECGTKKTVQGSLMSSGNTKSCGCLNKDVRAKRISINHSDLTAVILGYKRHAKRRGFVWDLDRNIVEKLVSSNCYYCGRPPSNVKVTKNTITPFLYNGIDRKINTIGYTVENVVPCCKICNRAKLDLDIETFNQWVLALTKNFKKEVEYAI